jgi:hypothetical protein
MAHPTLDPNFKDLKHSLLSFYFIFFKYKFHRISYAKIIKFAKNLRAFPFNKDLSNETTFSLIHIAEQYGTFKLVKTESKIMIFACWCLLFENSY